MNNMHATRPRLNVVTSVLRSEHDNAHSTSWSARRRFLVNSLTEDVNIRIFPGYLEVYSDRLTDRG